MSEHPTKLERAREWVERAIAAGLNPHLIHYPEGHRMAGRWYSQDDPVGGPDCPGDRPADILPEIRSVLYEMGYAYELRDGEFVRRKEAASA